MIDPIALNQHTYHHIAAQFAAVTADMPEAVANSIEKFLSQIRPDGLILDLGCGPGRDLAWMEARRAHVVGADLAFGMLAQAKQRAGKWLCQMEMRQLGFATGRFAGVWCNAAILHLPKQQVPDALKEIARVLAPGGLFSLSVQKGHGEGIESAPVYGGVERFIARYHPNEIGDLLLGAGFLVESSNISPDDPLSEKSWLRFEATKAK